MLTHTYARRQERSRHATDNFVNPPEASLASPPEVVDPDLDEATRSELLPYTHAAGHCGGDVDARGVPHSPSELVLSPVVVAVKSGLGLGRAAREVFPHAPVLARPPVIVSDVPRPRIAYRRSRPLASFDVCDLDPLPAAELDLLVREGHLVPGQTRVEGHPHLARIAPGRSPVSGLAGGLVPRGLRPPLLV